MNSYEITREEMWSRQQINSQDVNYELWAEKKKTLQQMSLITTSCLFAVDVYKERYDFASENFAGIFGFKASFLKNIGKQGDMIEDRIHPGDRDKIIDLQIKHSRFIYSLPPEERNDYQTIYQFRMRNVKNSYVNVISRQQVIQKDLNGKAWIIMGMMNLSPNQTPFENIKYSCLNVKTGDIHSDSLISNTKISLTHKEIIILQFIRQGLLSKEIAAKLDISIHTVNNHRKNILAKLNADNSIEAINYAINTGLLD